MASATDRIRSRFLKWSTQPFLRAAAIPRATVYALLLCLLAPGAGQTAEDDANAAVIERYNLAVADTPVRARPGWRSPDRIVVAFAGDSRLAWLQKAVPGVELVGADSRADALAQLPGADGLIGLCSNELLQASDRLRWIQVYSAGVENCLALPAFKNNPNPPLLTNMQHISAPVIAEHAIAMTLALSRNLETFIRAEEGGDWRRGREFTRTMRVVNGKTMLVVGLGGIGTETARRAHALGMTVIATRNSKPVGPDFVSRVGLPPDLGAFIIEADVVVNALPLTQKTRGLFDADLLGRMKESALFINVGRGGTVVTDDLVAALESGAIAGAGLDVTDPEPLPPDHPLWHAPNTIITPHVASRSNLGRDARWHVIRENLRRYAAGQPMLSVVDTAREY